MIIFFHHAFNGKVEYDVMDIERVKMQSTFGDLCKLFPGKKICLCDPIEKKFYDSTDSYILKLREHVVVFW